MFSCFYDCFKQKPKKNIKPLEGITIVKDDNSKEEIIFNKSYNSFTNKDFIEEEPKKFYLNKKALEDLNKVFEKKNKNLKTKSVDFKPINIKPKEIKQVVSNSEIIKNKNKNSSISTTKSISDYGFVNLDLELNFNEKNTKSENEEWDEVFL